MRRREFIAGLGERGVVADASLPREAPRLFEAVVHRRDCQWTGTYPSIPCRSQIRVYDDMSD
jgi:hypothetical protein